jgi:CelD/BcsL family acetyltransferase involved in cellulose biosynthesis
VGMSISEITTDDGFDRLQEEWNQLVLRLDVPSPFQSWEWCRTWWKHFGSTHRLRILVFRDAGEVIGIAPLHQRRYGPLHGPSVLAPLCWEDPRRKQGMTEQNELLFPAADRLPLMAALASWLQENPWSLALLPGNQMPPPFEGWLAEKLVLLGRPTWSYYRNLPATWADVVAGLGKSMRDNVKYYPRLLERSGHRTTLRVCATPAEVAVAIPVFFQLHQARAHSEATVAHEDRFRFHDRRAFLSNVGPVLAAAGKLKVGLLEVDNNVVAAQIWLETAGTMFIYYSGYDPAWSRFSVQLVATIECLKDGISRGLTSVEFLRGGGHAKERWETSKRLRVNATLARRPAVARLLLRVPRLQRRLRLRGTSANPIGAYGAHVG